MSKLQLALITIGAIVIAVGVILLLLLPADAPIDELPSDLETELPSLTIATTSNSVIGSSVEGRPIAAYRFGTGERDVLFVGGIHGGYEWNSVLLAYEMMDELTAGTINIPDDVTVHIIPNLNPDGLALVVGVDGRFLTSDVDESKSALGRFNANDVDLNRNFDCKWQPESTWRGNIVSAGTRAFSEPEAAALRSYILTNDFEGVVFWHSQANAVYASECENGILPGTRTLMDTYADAAAYQKVDVFDAYPVTGDAEGWLASIGIPAITVEFSSHTSLDWEKNLAGVEAVLTTYMSQ